ncbi:hypothetical protein DXG03_006010 [Asterophora parasitica]|uniref:Uncharacterized protein n=1 Tax=Asterophora parasitica TaxID=117018 RepID=A0A9P7KE28_9AGAR|nr:hypothetical protein DXG03_006010 [Asterophora parasitica]
MGGSAFASTLSADAFPRMPPAVYAALKTRLIQRIQSLYHCVAVPFEAPEKTSHGDLDLVVACPKITHNMEENVTLVANHIQPNVPHEIVQETIGARYVNPMDGNRTSNFAIPIVLGEWRALNHGAEEDEAHRAVDGGDIFYQVDLNVCADKEEWQRIVFFHGYGDLGMIMGLLARNGGLALGEKGLRLPDPPNAPIDLSNSFDDITEFMGWRMDAWKTGFRTKHEAFEWVASTPYFDLRKFRTRGEGFSKVKPERKMYAEFVEWAFAKQAAVEQGESDRGAGAEEKQKLACQENSLVYFNKKQEFDALVRVREQRARLKEIFSGSRVRDLAELGEYWKGVKLVMDAVRAKFGGDEGILKLDEKEGEEGVKRAVLEAKEQLHLT